VADVERQMPQAGVGGAIHNLQFTIYNWELEMVSVQRQNAPYA
jgi:hypothetical protein